MSETLSADYLVVGAGAMGMAFVDSILTESKKSVILVDKYARPGGHWIMAYPFVRLHQPAAFYGVASRPLGSDKIDEFGWNKGIQELASRDEILSYYDLVMRETFVPSGRVQYFPKHEYLGERKFRSILTNKTYEVNSETCIVDATYSNTKVPSMGPPAYEVAEGVQLVTPNDLPAINRGYGNYTVIGAGKTGIDSILWLLENGIPKSDITWIMPRDPLLYKRSPLKDFAASAVKGIEGTLAATSVEDVVKANVKSGQLMFFDEKIEPTMWHCPTISAIEHDALTKLESIVRKGRVVRLTPDEVVLTKGSYKPAADTLFVDCSASAVHKRPAIPVFQDKKITLQPVRHCQQTFSAAVIAHVESAYDDEEKKNYLCSPIPMPNVPVDFALTQVQTNTNALRWAQHPKTQEFIKNCRLDLFGRMMPPPPEDPKLQAEHFAKMLGGVQASTEKLRQLMEALPEPDAARTRNELESLTISSKI